MRALFVGSGVSHEDWEALHQAGLPFDYIDLATALRSLTVRFSPGQVAVCFPHRPQLERAYRLIWYHPGTFELLERSLATDGDYDRFIERQYTAALTFFERWLAGRDVCIDPPQLQRSWSNKLVQLQHLAEKFPDLVVDTTLTSKPPNDARMVVKHAGETRRVGVDNAFYARLLTPDTFGTLNAGHATPMLVQPELSAPAEYRTFWFDGTHITIRFPRRPDQGIVDLHYAPDAVASADVVSTPVSWSTLRALQDSIGLRFVAIDYFLLGAGKPRILEINPLFSWSWLPAHCVRAVADSIGRFLERAGEVHRADEERAGPSH